MISPWIIIVSLLVGFGAPLLIAIVVCKLDDSKSSKNGPVQSHKSNDQVDEDIAKLRFLKETEFWRDYNKP